MMNGTILQKLRTDRKLTQDEMADAMHVTKRTYAAWERGENDVSTDMLCRLADFFEVTTDYILGRVPFEIKKEAPPEKPDGVQRVQITLPQSASEEQQREALEALVQQMVRQELDRRNNQP